MLTAEIIPITDPAHWDKALARCINYDIYHTAWYHKLCMTHDTDLIMAYLLFVSIGDHFGDTNCAWPIVLCKSMPDTATSVHGYPGPVISTHALPLQHGDDITKTVEQLLCKLNLQTIITRSNPILANEGLLHHSHGYTQPHAGTTVAVQLQKSHKISKGHKANIKASLLNGLEVLHVESVSDIYQIHELYTNHMRFINADAAYIYPLQYFIDLFASSYSQFLICREKTTNVITNMSIWLLSPTRNIISYHLAASAPHTYDLGGAKLLVYSAMKQAAADGYTWMHLGGGVGGNTKSSLYRFKAGFGKLRMPYGIYTKQIKRLERANDK